MLRYRRRIFQIHPLINILLEKFRLIERFTPYVAGGRGPLRSDEAREWLERQRNEAIAEVTLAVSAVAMVAAIVASVSLGRPSMPRKPGPSREYLL